jgi:hypothetical protein
MNKFPRKELLSEVFRRVQELKTTNKKEELNGGHMEELTFLNTYLDLYYPANVAMRLGLIPYEEYGDVDDEDWKDPMWYKGEEVGRKEEVARTYPDLIDIML